MDYDKLLDMAAELGYQLMSSGAEIYRAEESVHRLLCAYELDAPEVFAIPNCIIISVDTPEGHPITRMRRIPGHGTDIDLLERCNGLCRRLCTQKPPLEEAQAAVCSLSVRAPRYKPWQVLLGYGMATAFFSPLFGGGALDALAALVCGLAVGASILYGGKIMGTNSFFRTVICAGEASFLSLLLVRMGLGHSVDIVTISVLMLLVPGMALTNAMREIMAGDIVSGLARVADALLIAGAIALGSGAGFAVGQAL